MKSAIFLGLRGAVTELRDVSIPEVGPNDVLVKVKACAICGTDLHAYKELLSGYSFWGHEFSGDAIAVGEDISGIKAGDRVTGFGVGGFAEYALITCQPYAPLPSITPLKLPDNVSYEAAAMIEPMAVSLNAVKSSGVKRNDTVLVFGAGAIGLGCVQVLKVLHPDVRVLVADVSEKRLAMASTVGADVTLDASEENVVAQVRELTGVVSVMSGVSGTNVDIVLECAGGSGTAQQAIEIVKPITGRIEMVARYSAPQQIDLNSFGRKSCTMHGHAGYTNAEWLECMDMISSERLNRDALISHRFPLDKIGTAFEAQMNAEASVQVVIIP